MTNWRFIFPNLITALALSTGFLSILAACHGNVEWAAKLVFLAMLLDGLDGNLARAVKGESAFGAEFDTYVDIIAFAVAPAMIIFESMNWLMPPWKTFLSLAVVLAGAARLSRFKAQDLFRGQKGYTGLPITIGAGWVALFVIANENGWTAAPVQIEKWFPAFFIVILLLCLVLQISNVHYAKPTKNLISFLVCAAPVVLLLIPRPLVNQIAFLFLFGAVAFYVLWGLFRAR